MQYDKSVIKSENKNFKMKIFLSSAIFKYPTLKLKQLKELNIPSIVAENCLHKMFPGQNKIELFARNSYIGWDNWGLEIPDNKINIKSVEELGNEKV